MADDFDPDAFLAGGHDDFDPDAFLGTKKSAETEIPKRGIFPRLASEEMAEKPHDTSIFGTPIPKSPEGGGWRQSITALGGSEPQMPYEPTEQFEARTPTGGGMKAKFAEATEKIKEAGKELYEDYDPRKGPGIPGVRPLSTFTPFVGKLWGMASDAAKAAASPVTGVTHPLIEQTTGIPGGQFTGALFTAGARGPAGAGLRRPELGPVTPPGPAAPSALSPAAREAARAPESWRPSQFAPEPAPAPAPAPTPAGSQRSVGAAGGANALEAASPEAQEMVQRSFEPSGYSRHSIEDTIEGLHPEETLGEVDEHLRGHMGGLQTTPGQQRIEIANTLRNRSRLYPERATGYLNDTFGEGVNVREWEADIKRQRKAAADPLWEKFENTRITPTPEIEAILPRLRAAGALSEANRFLAMEGKPATRGFPELPEEIGGGNAAVARAAQEHIPTAEAFQYAKEALDDDIASSKKAGARRRLMGIKNDLVNAIDNHPDPEVAGVWKAARDVWAGPTGILKAKDFGRKVLTDAVSPEEFGSLWGEMSPSNREGVRIGLRDMLGDHEGKKGTPGRRMANIESIINSPDNQLKIRTMVGDERAERLFRLFEQEQRMRQATPDIIGNSRTSERQTFRAFWAPPETGPLEKAAKVAGTVADVATLRLGSLAKKGLEYVGNRMDASATTRAQRIAEEAGRIYSTVGPERDAILRELTRRIEEGPGGLAGPVGRQPLKLEVSERGRSGRPTKRTPLRISQYERDIGEGREPTQPSALLARAEQRLGEGPRIVGSKKEMDDVLRKNWAEHGREADFDHDKFRGWDREVVKWNRDHPENPMPTGGYTFGTNRAFEQHAENTLLKNPDGSFKKQPYPGAKEANEYFAEDPDTHKHTAFTSLRQMRNVNEDLVPPTQQAMAFSNEPTRRRFLQGMASALAVANPELGKVAAGVTRATATLPRLEDAGYGRSLARQAMYMFGDDKKQAVDYLLEHIKRSTPGSKVDKANRGALKHITSGDIDKEPGIWAKSIAEMRAHDETIRTAQAARHAAEQAPAGTEEGSIRGRGELPGGEGRLEAPRAADTRPGERAPEPPLEGLPRKVTVPGIGKLDVGPHQPARDIARQYMEDAGLPYNPPKDYAKVDPERAARIAAAYDEMPHAPNDPEVKAAYNAMAKETMAQWHALKKSGLEVEFIPPGMPDPYDASPRLVAEDVKKNNHMWVFSTRDGFGTLEGFDPSTNPLLVDSGEKISGKPALLNDIFRAVHDYFGHIKEGVGFRADGEENAWRSHSAMYSPLARKAMTSETRGQNSWLNYGPHGDKNRTAKTLDTVYADQKTGVLPDWVVNEGSGLPERISSAAVKIGDQVFEGGNHALAIDAAREQLNLPHEEFRPLLNKAEDGFTTSEGRFVNREEANNIADKAGQINKKSGYYTPEHLASESLREALKRNVHTVDITPRLRESVFVHGLPQFASGGAVKPPMRARAKYHYANDRGTNAEHCGNCSMFRAPHGCTAVGGFIVRMGKCDIWEAARARRAEGGRVSHLDAADQALKLSPEERSLYQRHLTNLWGKGEVDNPDGSRSTLYQVVVEHKGKFHNIPTVWDGKILDPDKAVDRAHAEGIEKFPSYATPDEADARYDDMHRFMEKDTSDYFNSQEERAEGGSVFDERFKGESRRLPTHVPGGDTHKDVVSTKKSGPWWRSETAVGPPKVRDSDTIAAPYDPNYPPEVVRAGGGRVTRQYGGGMQGFPWQSMMSSPWFQQMMSRFGGRGGQAAPWFGTGAAMVGRDQPPAPQANPPANPPAGSTGVSTMLPAPTGGMQLPGMPGTAGGTPPTGIGGIANPPNSGGVSATPPPPTGGLQLPPLQGTPGVNGGDANPPASVVPQLGLPGSTGTSYMMPPSTMMNQAGGNAPMLPGGGASKSFKHGGAVEPTDGQKKAGNYKKRHVTVHGLDISIENERGSMRSGKDRGGKAWSVKMPAHYGYIKRSTGADGDHVDCYIGPHVKSPNVWIVDQIDADSRRWDEHKCFIGFASEAQVRRIYAGAFSDGKGHHRIGSIRKMSIDAFKSWLRDGNTTKPIARAA